MNVLILVAEKYNGHELWVTLGVLQSRGHSFEVASTGYLISDEVTGQPNKIGLLVSDIKSVDKYDALMVVSGDMAKTEAYWTLPEAQKIVGWFFEQNKPIAAICCSVPTIRKAAKGKRVSYFPLIRSRELLEQAGAIPTTLSVTVDGTLVTAEHQMATQMWVESFCDVLEGKTPEITLTDSGFEPGKREGKPIPELEYLKHVAAKTGRIRIDKEEE